MDNPLVNFFDPFAQFSLHEIFLKSTKKFVQLYLRLKEFKINTTDVTILFLQIAIVFNNQQVFVYRFIPIIIV